MYLVRDRSHSPQNNSCTRVTYIGCKSFSMIPHFLFLNRTKHLWKADEAHTVFLMAEIRALCREGSALMDCVAWEKAGQKTSDWSLTDLWPTAALSEHCTTHTRSQSRSCWWTCFPDSRATLACGLERGNAPSGRWNQTTCCTLPLHSLTPSLLCLPNTSF